MVLLYLKVILTWWIFHELQLLGVWKPLTTLLILGRTA
ncbi:hypothetical protein bthur0010_54770 [Bacillus thuringiensis serovar pondicheriensis BGSC 4BA1]|nr:hypothetical protein bthur0010_54770 [Bacillus thuringiensis serovar pondicheriensis BGSC 4BA1]